jgi:hypothetical protein
MRIVGVIALVITLWTNTFGTDPYYQWESSRKRYVLTADESAKAEIFLKKHVQFDYVLENNQFLVYSTIHQIILVNNSEAIEKHNRIYIDMSRAMSLVDVKARVIKKNGEVINFDKNNLKELKEEQGAQQYQIFAMEGVELGSEIEFYYTKKEPGRIFNNAYVQSGTFIKNSSFTLNCPKHLKFDFRSYYGYPEVKFTEATETNQVNNYTVNMDNVSPLKEEPFSSVQSNLMRVEFKLAYNSARGKARLYTWEDAAKSYYKTLSEQTKDDAKALEKFVKTIGDQPSMPIAKRIRNVENKIKTTFQINTTDRSEGLGNISAIIKYKIASQEGLTKLMMSVFDQLKITCYPVLTCSREHYKFDPTFDSWAFLDEYLLYFPDTKSFLSPYAIQTRYPLAPAEFTANHGLFIEPFTIGEVKSALGSVQEIPAAPYQWNNDNLSIEVKIRPDFASNEIKLKREFGGYNASFLTPYYNLMTEVQRKEMVEEMMKQTAPDLTMTKWTAKPIEADPVDKFEVEVEFNSSHFMESAGSRVLFKVGELIGPQVEMYRDDERKSVIENQYNRAYDRVIKISIPEGFAIKNAKDLNFDQQYADKGKVLFQFTSAYEVQNSVLTITIKEYYKEIFAPVERYEEFRKVVNAAADFNKVTLVLEKKI